MEQVKGSIGRSAALIAAAALAALAVLTATRGAAGAGYESVALPDGGGVAGTVRVSGPRTTLPALEVFKHPEVCGKTVPDDALVVGDEGALRYAVVSLENVTRGRAVEREAVNVIDNRACRFVPHVLSAAAGQWLVIRNSDPILHNADARRDGKVVFNVAIPTGREIRRPLVEPGLLTITCDVRHTWMLAYVAVFAHPYHAVTDADGVYEILDVPPGRYTVRIWHERFGEQRKEVQVEAGKTTPLDFVLGP